MKWLIQYKFFSICLTAPSRAVVTAIPRIGEHPIIYYDLNKLLWVIDSTLTHVIPYIINFNELFIEYAHDSLDISKIIYHSIYALSSFLLALHELKLYKQMKLTMKSYLNFYYLTHFKNIRVLKYINIWFYLTFGIIHLSIAIFDIQLDSIVKLNTIKEYNSTQKLWFIWLNIIFNIPLFLYVFFNTYNIKFKEWIFVVLWGYKISRYYCDCSIFIAKISHKSRSLSISQSDCLEGSSETHETSVNPDYEINDDYMQNFKSQYLSSSEILSDASNFN